MAQGASCMDRGLAEWYLDVCSEMGVLTTVNRPMKLWYRTLW